MVATEIAPPHRSFYCIRHVGSGHFVSYMLPRAHKSLHRNGTSIGSFAFAELAVVTDRQTSETKLRQDICSNRPHLTSAAMRPQIKLGRLKLESISCAEIRNSVNLFKYVNLTCGAIWRMQKHLEHR